MKFSRVGCRFGFIMSEAILAGLFASLLFPSPAAAAVVAATVPVFSRSDFANPLFGVEIGWELIVTCGLFSYVLLAGGMIALRAWLSSHRKD